MISFENIYKKYDGDETPVFAGFNEKIEDGEFIVLTGRSGSGKTTLIRMLTKETEPDAGEIYIDRRRLSDIGRNSVPDYRRGIGVIFQDFRLFNDYTVYGNLELTLSLTGGDRRSSEEKITHVLTMMRIDHLHKRYPRELSGGEKQKVCMARAIINNPKVVLADEPTGNLDPGSSAEIAELLRIIHCQGITVIMATHDMAAVEDLKNDVRIISLDRKL